MRLFRIAAAGLVLCLFISWTSAYPAPQKKVEEDEDEIDSDEAEFNKVTQIVVDRLGLKNMTTNQELAEKASQFLVQYFNNVGPDAPINIPNASNHTIIITIVPNNGSSNGTQQFLDKYNNMYVSSLTPQQLENVQFAPPPPRAVVDKPAIPSAITTSTSERPFKFNPSKPLQPSNSGQDNIEDAILEALSFVQGQVPSNVAGPEASLTKNPVSSNSASSLNFQGNSYPEPPQNNFQVPNDPRTPAPVRNTIPQSASYPSSSNQVPINSIYLTPEQQQQILQYQQRQQQLQQQQQQLLHQQHHQQQQQQIPSNVIISTPVQTTTPQPLIIVLPPQETGTEATRRRPAGPNPLFLGLNLFGNLAEGDLGSALENTFQLAETPLVQDTARLATVGLIHNVFEGFNCQVFRNCNRAPIKVVLP